MKYWTFGRLVALAIGFIFIILAIDAVVGAEKVKISNYFVVPTKPVEKIYFVHNGPNSLHLEVEVSHFELADGKVYFAEWVNPGPEASYFRVWDDYDFAMIWIEAGLGLTIIVLGMVFWTSYLRLGR